jgi:hypothetical protein
MSTEQIKLIKGCANVRSTHELLCDEPCSYSLWRFRAVAYWPIIASSPVSLMNSVAFPVAPRTVTPYCNTDTEPSPDMRRKSRHGW